MALLAALLAAAVPPARARKRANKPTRPADDRVKELVARNDFGAAERLIREVLDSELAAGAGHDALEAMWRCRAGSGRRAMRHVPFMLLM